MCTLAGGCRKSVHKMADAHDISSSFHVGHARPMRPPSPLELGETLSSSVLNVAWSPGSAAT